ncbi:MAG: hypothetical protein IJ684_02810 [Bacteroidales bacterium]|nr:hypothetical protein [Bacteroidales bacterium]
MKRMGTATLAVALLLLSLTGCGRKPVVDETRYFANQRWKWQEPERFEFDIKKTSECYNLVAEVYYDTAVLRRPTLPLIVDLQSPNGERRTFQASILLRTRDGHCTGTVIGDFASATATLKKYFFFNTPGTQQLVVTQGTDRYELAGVSRLTLRVEPAPTE